MDEERAREGLNHLQTAMKELIAAARAALDVAEDLVDDPSVVSAAVDAVRDVVAQAAEAARSATGAMTSGPAPDNEEPPIQRIKVL